MKRFVDTSVLVRYLLNDIPDQAERARLLLTSGHEFWITPTVLLETAFVLERYYRIGRSEVVDALMRLLREPHLHLYGLDYLATLQALLACRRPQVDYGDALVWAAARAEAGEIYTLDQDFLDDGVPVYDLPQL